MSGRTNSNTAYFRIKEEGLLPPMRMRVYQALYNLGPSTASELQTELRKSRDRIGASGDNVHARIGELQRQGVVETLRSRECSVTGETVFEYNVCWNALPKKIKRNAKKSPFASLSNRQQVAVSRALASALNSTYFCSTLTPVDASDLRTLMARLAQGDFSGN